MKLPISTSVELLQYLVDSYNDGCDPADALTVADAPAYFDIPLTELSKVDGTGPWLRESYGDRGDCFDPDWVELGFPEFVDGDVPCSSLVIRGDTLVVACSVPGSAGLEWTCWVFVK